MAGNQLQAKIKEASKVLSGKFSKRKDIEEEMGLIEEQQLEAKSEERNSGMRYSIGEDASTHSKKEIGLKKVQQERRVKEIDENDVAAPMSNSLSKMLDEIHPSLTSEFSIYRVPQLIRKLNEEAYHPRIISIGPFHNGDERFKPMEVFKKRFFKKIIEREPTVGLEKYVNFVTSCEAKARQCYSEIIDMGSNEFVTMLLLDGCFIVELLICNYYKDWRCVDFSILYATRLWEDIHHDFRLLENQIPFFVLEGLFNLATTYLDGNFVFMDTAFYFHFRHNHQEISANSIDSVSVNHFVDMILIFHQPIEPKRIAGIGFQTTRTATELHEAGVKFKMSSSKCLFDIEFDNGILQIPRIVLDDITEPMIRNLMALEVCHFGDNSYIIDYFYFMDYLINTPKDVDLLVQSGIIQNWLGDSKEAATLFNNMNKNITISDNNYYFSSLCGKINAYCKSSRHEWRAILMRDYFSTPWRIASVIAAFVLLGLTTIQTVFSILSWIQGYSKNENGSEKRKDGESENKTVD